MGCKAKARKGSFGAKKFGVLIEKSLVDDPDASDNRPGMTKLKEVEIRTIVGIVRPNRGRRLGAKLRRRGSRPVNISHKAMLRQVQKTAEEKKPGLVQRLKTAFNRKGA